MAKHKQAFGVISFLLITASEIITSLPASQPIRQNITNPKCLRFHVIIQHKIQRYFPSLTVGILSVFLLYKLLI